MKLVLFHRTPVKELFGTLPVASFDFCLEILDKSESRNNYYNICPFVCRSHGHSL